MLLCTGCLLLLLLLLLLTLRQVCATVLIALLAALGLVGRDDLVCEQECVSLSTVRSGSTQRARTEAGLDHEGLHGRARDEADGHELLEDRPQRHGRLLGRHRLGFALVTSR